MDVRLRTSLSSARRESAPKALRAAASVERYTAPGEETGDSDVDIVVPRDAADCADGDADCGTDDVDDDWVF